MNRRTHVSALALVAALLAAVATAVSPAGAQDTTSSTTPPDPPPSIQPPGVYVEEQPAGAAVATDASGILLAVGSGTPSSSASPSNPVEVTSLDEFTSLVQNPSTLLANGMDAFFGLGGSVAYVQLTRDESAASLAAGLDDVSLPLGSFDLIAVPAIAQLDVAGHQSVAIAADQLATRTDSVVLLDTPDEIAATEDPATVVPWAVALDTALPAGDAVMVVSAGLLGQEQQLVPGSLAVAGLVAADDAQHGFGALGVGGLGQPLTDYEPVWPVTNDQVDALLIGGVNSFRDVVGYGTLLWGNAMMSSSEADPARHLPLGPRRVLAQIERTMTLVAQAAVFDDNDQETWDDLTLQLDAYLTGLWQDGALVGSTPSEAYSVSVGLDTTMTEQDVLNGYMVITVEAAVVEPAEFVPVTITQEMAD